MSIYYYKAVFCSYQGIGNYSYLTYAIPNVAPGTHKLQIRVSSPDYFSSEFKNDYMTIVVPEQTTSAAVKIQNN